MIIKFNLLLKKIVEVESKEKKLSFFKIYFSILSFIILSLIFLIYNNYSIYKNLEKEKKEKLVLLNKYKNIAIKVKNLEKENEEIKKRIEIVVNLKKDQSKNLKYLAELIKNVKPDKLILTSLKIQNDNCYLKGLSLDMAFLAYYMQSLEGKKDLIKNVNLKTAYQKEVSDLKLVEFELEVKF
ncbi:MAG: PilN domain-containing protein [Caldimicrobium sp.]|jgi:type IV pilus assembly protein PilN